MTKARKSHQFHLLLHAADLVQDHLRVQLLPLEVSPQQARVIKALGRMGTVSQVDLAREFGITAASMSTMTSRLIALDLIAAQKDPSNAKRNLISLTGKGEALLGDISRVWAGVDTFIEEKIGSDNTQELAELARLLRDALGGRRPGDGRDAV